MNFVRKGYGCILVAALLVLTGCSMLRSDPVGPLVTPLSQEIIPTPGPQVAPLPPAPQTDPIPDPQPDPQKPIENIIAPPVNNDRKDDSNRGKHLEAVYFDFNIHDLNEEAKIALDRNFAVLDKDKSVYTVEGYCDERGSASYNIALGQKRAEKAKKYLESRGISANRLNATSYGLEYPAVSGSTEQAFKMNRRVEFWIMGSPEPGQRGK